MAESWVVKEKRINEKVDSSFMAVPFLYYNKSITEKRVVK